MGSCARGIYSGNAAAGARRLRQRRVTRVRFHAASALFALEGRTFTKHSALEAAVHRDLVKAGRWPADLGRDYSFCLDVRGVGDYGSDVRVDASQAEDSTAAARRILMVISEAMPKDFPRLPDT
jgi:uncharacterized protein (UPF0332 family)